MDYTDFNLDPYLNSKNSLHNSIQKTISVDFDATQEVQTKNINSSQAYIPTLVKLSGGGTTIGTVLNGEWIEISWSLRTTPSQMLLADWHHAVYQGTTTSNTAFIVYPRLGGSIGTGDYEGWSSGDNQFYQANPTVGTVKEKSYNSVHILNKSGTTQTLNLTARAKYIVNQTEKINV